MGVEIVTGEKINLEIQIQDLRMAAAENALQLRMAETENDALRERIKIQTETIDVLRDALGAHQATNRLHSAEAAVLINELRKSK